MFDTQYNSTTNTVIYFLKGPTEQRDNVVVSGNVLRTPGTLMFKNERSVGVKMWFWGG